MRSLLAVAACLVSSCVLEGPEDPEPVSLEVAVGVQSSAGIEPLAAAQDLEVRYGPAGGYFFVAAFRADEVPAECGSRPARCFLPSAVFIEGSQLQTSGGMMGVPVSVDGDSAEEWARVPVYFFLNGVTDEDALREGTLEIELGGLVGESFYSAGQRRSLEIALETL